MKSGKQDGLFVAVLISICVAALVVSGGGAPLQVAVKPPAVPSGLFTELKSSDPATRRAAAIELGRLRAKVAVRSLIGVLSDKHPGVREAAAFALGQITEPRAAEPLFKVMSDKDPEVRASAAFALGMLDDRKAIKVLIGALDDPEAAVRSSAVVGLALMRDEASLDELIAMLNDSSFDVRYDAVWALGYLGEPEAASHLRAAPISLDLIRLSDASREAFRQAVQTALENLRTGENGPSRPRRVTASADVLNRVTRSCSVVQAIRPAPTERASRAGVRGVVGLRVLVGADGAAVRAYVTQRLGSGLDQRAVAAALQYRFSPALLHGLPQTEWVNLDVSYE